uniref:Secreted protein n=1 Tax=Rhipicephalus zambeziensis TaxID=60191 RepID=A0A224Y932_9ACAR
MLGVVALATLLLPYCAVETAAPPPRKASGRRRFYVLRAVSMQFLEALASLPAIHSFFQRHNKSPKRTGRHNWQTTWAARRNKIPARIGRSKWKTTWAARGNTISARIERHCSKPAETKNKTLMWRCLLLQLRE